MNLKSTLCVQKQPASPERDEMLEICKGNIEEFSMMIQLVAVHHCMQWFETNYIQSRNCRKTLDL